MKGKKGLIFVFVCILLFGFCLSQTSVSTVEENNNVQADCAQLNDCDSCTDESTCVWCETDQECQNGGFFGPDTFFPSCSDWKWKQCFINGRYYTWYPIFIIIIILLIACVCGLITCLFCNPILFCYNKWKKKGDYVRWEKLQEEMSSNVRGPTDSEVRRDSLRTKYNLND